MSVKVENGKYEMTLTSQCDGSEEFYIYTFVGKSGSGHPKVSVKANDNAYVDVLAKCM